MVRGQRGPDGRDVSPGVLASLQDATTHCPVCGVALIYAADDHTNAHASLDRIVPGVPYTITGNLAITCIACNRVRTDADLKRLRQLIIGQREDAPYSGRYAHQQDDDRNHMKQD